MKNEELKEDGRRSLSPRSASHSSFFILHSSFFILHSSFFPGLLLFFHFPADVPLRIRRVPARRVPENAVERVLVRRVLLLEVQRQRLLRPVQRLARQLL